MKITWVADNTFEDIPTGGAEATNRALIDSCPFPIIELNPTTLERKEQLLENDLVIFGNIKWFFDEQIEWMLECPTRIKYEHDYWNLVRPHQEQYKQEFWEGCSVCIFHSPAHVEEYVKMYPFEYKNIWLQPSCMDTDKMHSDEKEDVTLYVGSLTSHKGVMDALAWGEENGTKIHVYGIGEYREQVIAHPYSIYCGVIDYKGLLDLYAKAKRFIFLPNWIDPFARIVVEARLSGCELILNDKIGVMSYDWWNKNDKEVSILLKEYANSFWKILDIL